MNWMPAPNEETCELVSHAIYRLTRPAGSAVNDSTRYAFGWRQDKNGQWFMDFHPELVLPIHPERSQETAEALAMFVQRGQISPQSAAAIAALVQERTGDTVTLGEVTPPEWLAAMVENPEWPTGGVPA